MPFQAVRDRLKQLDYQPDGNSGLLLDKYVKTLGDDHQAQHEVYKHLQGQTWFCNPSSVYLLALKMRIRCAVECGCGSALFRSVSRVAVGLGADSVLENSLTLSRTYGTPAIPGEALKGLARHYCLTRLGGFRKGVVETCNEATDMQRAPYLPSPVGWHDGSLRGQELAEAHAKIEELASRGIVDPDGYSMFDYLFGHECAAACVAFHEAWWVPESSQGGPFLEDVMTVHHQDYYSGDPSTGNVPPPADYDSPNPIPFIDVGPGNVFWVTVAGEPALRTLGLKILGMALADDGIGAKTSTGFGHLKLIGNEDLRNQELNTEFMSFARREPGPVPVSIPTPVATPPAATRPPAPPQDPAKAAADAERGRIRAELGARFEKEFDGRHPVDVMTLLKKLPDEEALFRSYAADKLSEDARVREWKKTKTADFGLIKDWRRAFETELQRRLS